MVENSEQKPDENPAQMNVLLVDDDPNIHTLFEMAFQLNEFTELTACNLLTATNIQEARTILEANKVHIVFLDNRLPGGGGIDFAREIRKNPTEHPYADVPFVLISGTQKSDLGAEDRHLFFELLPKPFDLEEMAACVQKVRILKYPIDVSNNDFSGPRIDLNPGTFLRRVA